MPKTTSKTRGGHVLAENLSGRKVPTKGLKDQTTGKGAGKGNVRRTGGTRTISAV